MSNENHKFVFKSGEGPVAKAFEAKGRAWGRVETTQSHVLTILDERKLGPSNAARARIEACQDIAMLERWLVRAVTAASEEAVFEEC